VLLQSAYLLQIHFDYHSPLRNRLYQSKLRFPTKGWQAPPSVSLLPILFRGRFVVYVYTLYAEYRELIFFFWESGWYVGVIGIGNQRTSSCHGHAWRKARFVSLAYQLVVCEVLVSCWISVAVICSWLSWCLTNESWLSNDMKCLSLIWSGVWRVLKWSLNVARLWMGFKRSLDGERTEVALYIGIEKGRNASSWSRLLVSHSKYTSSYLSKRDAWE